MHVDRVCEVKRSEVKGKSLCEKLRVQQTQHQASCAALFGIAAYARSLTCGLNARRASAVGGVLLARALAVAAADFSASVRDCK